MSNWEKKWKLFVEGRTIDELGIELESSVTDPEKLVELFYTKILREPYYCSSEGVRTISSRSITFRIPDQNSEYVICVYPTNFYGASSEELNTILPQDQVKILRHVNSKGKTGYVKPDLYISGTEASNLAIKLKNDSINYIRDHNKDICNFFEQNGYYLTHDKLRESAWLKFIPKLTKPLSREEVNKLSGGYFYHFSPSIYEDAVKEEGLRARNDKVSLNYNEPRLYLWPGKQADTRGSLSIIKSTVAGLKQMAKAKLSSREEKDKLNTVSRYTVKLPEDCLIYLDLEYPQDCKINPMYIKQDLPVSFIQEIKHFDVSGLTNGTYSTKGRLKPLDEKR